MFAAMESNFARNFARRMESAAAPALNAASSGVGLAGSAVSAISGTGEEGGEYGIVTTSL